MSIISKIIIRCIFLVLLTTVLLACLTMWIATSLKINPLFGIFISILLSSPFIFWIANSTKKRIDDHMNNVYGKHH